jgi:heterogeneous nuclear ribonucleoprotein K
MAGAIIGRGGEKIKELRDQTGANLKVFSECAPLSTDRVLLISAAQEKIPEVVKQLVEFMKDIPIKGATKQYGSFLAFIVLDPASSYNLLMMSKLQFILTF